MSSTALAGTPPWSPPGRNAAEGWGDELAEQKAAPPNQVGSVWAGVRRAFDSLADPRVARACSPRPGEGFDPEEFIANGDTLYLLGSNKATLSVAPLVVALVEDIIEAGRRVAAVSPSERMALPLTLALDELANIAPLPSLPFLLGDGRGLGFQTYAVFQSLAQARARWGVEEAEVIWDTCTCRMILPGSANQRDNKNRDSNRRQRCTRHERQSTSVPPAEPHAVTTAGSQRAHLSGSRAVTVTERLAVTPYMVNSASCRQAESSHMRILIRNRAGGEAGWQRGDVFYGVLHHGTGVVLHPAVAACPAARRPFDDPKEPGHPASVVVAWLSA